MYAIVFDLDVNQLEELYPKASWRNAYMEIRKFLEDRGFEHMQGSVYFGNENVDNVACTLAVIEMTESFDWFSGSVRDIRMLEIDSNNDLNRAVEMAAERQARNTETRH